MILPICWVFLRELFQIQKKKKNKAKMTIGDVFTDTNAAHRPAFIITFISISIKIGFVNGIFCNIIYNKTTD